MPTRVASLTGLRAVAAAAVCLTHAAFFTGNYTNDFLGSIWARFEIGVPIFFALSGFLLFRPWVALAHNEAGHQPDLRRYAWHRFRKVVPAYWVVVTFIYLMGLVRTEPNPSGGGIDGYLRNMGFVQIYGTGHLRVGLTQAWSLAVEMAFYLALPLIGWLLTAVICRYRWRPIRLLVALVLLAAITPVWAAIAPGVALTARIWPPAYLWWFVGGMVLTVLAQLITHWPRRATAAALLVAASAFLISAVRAVGGEPTMVPLSVTQAITKSALYLVVAVALITPLALAPVASSCYHRLLGSAPMVWLGVISYEYFLVHPILMDLVLVDLLRWRPFTGSALLAFALVSVVAVPIAWALHAALPFGEGERGARHVGGRRQDQKGVHSVGASGTSESSGAAGVEPSRP